MYLLNRYALFWQITEDFIAAYQANYGFSKEGDPEESNATVSSTGPVAPILEDKPTEEQKPQDTNKNPNTEKHETPTKDAKPKGEKRKAEPGKVTQSKRTIKSLCSTYMIEFF